MLRRYVMAISCICHYRPAHKLVTAHLECRDPPLRLSFTSCGWSFPLHPPTLSFVRSFSFSSFSCRVRSPFALVYVPVLLAFVRYSLGRSLIVFLFFFLRFPFFFLRREPVPPSCSHSGGEASIVIVPHQRRSAINLSPCRAESERCSFLGADHTRNTGRAINLCPPAIV